MTDNLTAPPAVEPSPEQLRNSIRNMETMWEVPEGSLTSLFQEDDWSTVIKAQALIEGAVTWLLSTVLDARLKTPFGHLELGRDKTGKLEFAKALGLLTKGQCTYITKLSNIRNNLAHDPRYLRFTFEQHIAGLDPQQKKAFYNSLLFDLSPENEDTWRTYAYEHPKEAVIAATFRVLYTIILTGIEAQLNQTLTKYHVDYGRAALAAEESTVE